MIGIAVGDALGLPAEGMTPYRMAKRFPGEWRHRFFLGRGMVSDDTEHAFFTAQCLLTHPNSPLLFERCLSWSLRWWLLSLPAGTGWATLRACLRLWIGIPPAKSGVFSAGNGPALRAIPIGAIFAKDPDLRCRYLKISTRITHTDPKALIGAKALGDLIAWSVEEAGTEPPRMEDFILRLVNVAPENAEWKDLLKNLKKSLEEGLSVREYSLRLGLERGVSGYMYHTLPVAIYAWYRHYGDFEKSLASTLSCGGDTDSTGAIVGALAGAVTGEAGIPTGWIDGIMEWPRGIPKIRQQARALYAGSMDREAAAPVSYFWPGVVLRNLFFILVVLGHGFRRCFPPY